MSARVMLRVAALLMILLPCSAAYSQDYLFQVPHLEMTVLILTDGSAAIGYDMDFRNEPGAHPIDIVDVGFPNETVDRTTAYLNGQDVYNMRTSEYVKPGYEVSLPSPIEPGDSGRFEFYMLAHDMVYQDVTRSDYASFQITPTWFGSKYVRGVTGITVRVFLPPGVKPEEALSQDIEFSAKETLPWPAGTKWETALQETPGANLKEYVTVVTFNEQRPLTGPFLCGVSFPSRVMAHVIPMSRFGLLWKWYESLPSVIHFIILALSGVLFLVGFYRFTGGTGFGCLARVGVVFLFLFFSGLKVFAPQIGLYGPPFFAIPGLLMLLLSRFSKPRYVPALVSVEGGGIKRGLTAPEAASLLELPPPKIAAMVLFGMIKKDFLRQVTPDPPAFEEGAATGAMLPYEKKAADIIKASPGMTAASLDLGPVVKEVMASLVAKMKGYNVEQTREYYRQIVSRAWEEVKESGMDDIQWQKKVEDKVDWMMLDPTFNTRFVPIQTRYSATSASVGRSSSVPTVSGGPAMPGPGFSQVAAGFSGWMENTAGSLVATVAPTRSGLVDLSSLDKAMESKGGGSSRGGGGGGSCACACAGCACACACAGGGR